MIITCTKLAEAGLWDLAKCCVSCHGEEEADDRLGECWPPRNRWKREPKVWFAHCCKNHTLTFSSSRDDWARVVWAIRRG